MRKTRLALRLAAPVRRLFPDGTWQKMLVQQSFALVAPIAQQAGALFYDRLFDLDPNLRRLFPGDLREQSQKLMQMLAVAVRSLDDIGSITPALHALGRRHVAYGVTAEHFDTVANALPKIEHMRL